MTYCQAPGSGGWCQSTAPCMPGECKYREKYRTIYSSTTQPPAELALPEFWQLTKLTDGRAVVYVTEEQWNVLRQCWTPSDSGSVREET